MCRDHLKTCISLPRFMLNWHPAVCSTFIKHMWLTPAETVENFSPNLWFFIALKTKDLCLFYFLLLFILDKLIGVPSFPGSSHCEHKAPVCGWPPSPWSRGLDASLLISSGCGRKSMRTWTLQFPGKWASESYYNLFQICSFKGLLVLLDRICQVQPGFNSSNIISFPFS